MLPLAESPKGGKAGGADFYKIGRLPSACLLHTVNFATLPDHKKTVAT